MLKMLYLTIKLVKSHIKDKLDFLINDGF